MDLKLAIAIIGCIMGVLGFYFSRREQTSKETQDESYHLGQIDTKLKNIENVLGKIEKKLDTYDSEIDEKIEKAILKHEKQYHKGE